MVLTDNSTYPSATMYHEFDGAKVLKLSDMANKNLKE